MGKKFEFKLEALLKYRESRRDMCRQYLSQVLAEDQKLIDQKTEIQNNYAETEHHLKLLGQSGQFEIDKASVRRFHLGQLKLQMLQVDEQRRQLEEKLELCRKALLQADQEVKAIEKIKDKKISEHHYEQIKVENRELEENWQAAQLGMNAGS